MSKIELFYWPEWTSGGPHENEFCLFSYTKVISQTVWTEKLYEKNGVTCPVCMWLSWAMVLKLSKIVSFMQFYADISKKFTSVIAIYI